MEAIDALERRIESKLSSLNVDLVLLYRDRLETIDVQIVQCREVLEQRAAIRLQQVQSSEQYPVLKRSIARYAERTTELEGDPQGSRRYDLLGVQSDQADLGCR